MDQIICIFNLFDMKHPVFRVDSNSNKEKIGEVTLDKIDNFITTQCILYNISQVHLFGNKSYAQKICNKIHEYEQMTYGKNEIKIEVN